MTPPQQHLAQTLNQASRGVIDTTEACRIIGNDPAPSDADMACVLMAVHRTIGNVSETDRLALLIALADWCQQLPAKAATP